MIYENLGLRPQPNLQFAICNSLLCYPPYACLASLACLPFLSTPTTPHEMMVYGSLWLPSYANWELGIVELGIATTKILKNSGDTPMP